MRKCRICGEEKEDHWFPNYTDKRNGIEYVRKICQVCSSKRNKENNRRNQLQYNYGIDDLQYEQILKSQGGVCAICGQPETMKHCNTVIALAVDHSHETGKIRGLLCSACNSSIGKFKDDSKFLRKAADYLEKNK